MEYRFNVEKITAGQKRKYGDSYYHYIVTSDLAKYVVRDFCMNVLGKCFEGDMMPNPFSGELLEFTKMEGTENKYTFRYKTLYTG